MAEAPRDQNRVPAALGVNDITGATQAFKTDADGNLLISAIINVSLDDLTDVVLTNPLVDGQVLTYDSVTSKWVNEAVTGTGDVVGPASSTDNAIVRFNLTTGKLIQDSDAILDDSENLTGIGNITGKSGGITLTGGTGASDALTLTSTSNGTKGKITLGSSVGVNFTETNNCLALGATDTVLNVFETTGVGRFVVATDSALFDGVEIGLIKAGGSGTTGPQIFAAFSRGTLSSPTVVQDGDELFAFGALGYDGTSNFIAASIGFGVDGTPGDANIPGNITFNTTATGSSFPTNRLILDSVGTLKPATNDGAALGTGALSYSDLFLASGGVVNWNNGDVTITHSSNLLTLAGGDFSTGANIIITHAVRCDASDGILFEASNGTDVAIFGAGNTANALFYGATSFTGAALPSVDNTPALGASGQAWADLFLGSGSVINFNAGDVTITHSANTLTFAGGTIALGAASASTLAISNGGSINDANGNEQIIFTTTASAVNELTVANAATGANPTITASGGDSNVGINFQAKGTGAYRFLGTASQAAEIRLFEDTDNGTNYTAFRVGTQSADITYTLPTAQGASSTVLQNDGSGNLSWATVSAGGTYLSGVSSDASNCIVAIQNLADTGYYTFTSNGSGSASAKVNMGNYKLTAGNAAGRFTVVTPAASGTVDYSGKFGFVISFNVEATTSQDVYVGFDNGGIVDSSTGITQNATSNTDHAGFYIEDGTLYASNGSGSAQTRTDITSGVTLTDLNSYYLKGTASSIEFYVNNTLKATHTTNLPNSVDGTFRMGIESQAAANKVLNINNGFPIQAKMSF